MTAQFVVVFENDIFCDFLVGGCQNNRGDCESRLHIRLLKSFVLLCDVFMAFQFFVLKF